MTIIAEWKGGPFDGRLDALPDDVHAVHIAMPMRWGPDPITGAETPVGDYVEVRCYVVCQDGDYYIMWHEP